MGIDAEIYALVPYVPTEDQLKQWSFDIADRLGAKKFFLDADKGYSALQLTDARYREVDDPEPGTVIHQDGPDEVAPDGHRWIKAHIYTRYYGEGYERGDLLFICAVAEWIEQNIPDSVVWYGGDSSGVCAAPWPDSERRKLRAHFYGPRGADYFNYDDRRTAFGLIEPRMEPPRCSLCPAKRTTCHYGYGKSDLFSCGGCGKHFETKDKGKTWAEINEEG